MLSLGNEQMIDLIGRKVGGYYLRRVIGQGSYSYVYSGWHGTLQKEYAVKVLRPNLASSEQAAIVEEARRMATLDHPHIARVYDCGLYEDPPYTLPYIAMQHAPYTLLQKHRRGSKLPPELIVTYVRQLASALDYAHANHIIHCDIKPENILLDAKGMLLLTDFGIAVTHGQNHPGAGTPTYMAPELALGYPVPASDQYALGIMVYEWLCGSAPFRFPLHVTPEEVYQTHFRRPVPPLRARGINISPYIEEVVMDALSKRPEGRFKSVTAFATALTQACQTARPSPPPASPPLAQEPQEPISLHDTSGSRGHPDVPTEFDPGKEPVPEPDFGILAPGRSVYLSTTQESLSPGRLVKKIKHDSLKWDDRYFNSKRYGLFRFLGFLLNTLAAGLLALHSPNLIIAVVIVAVSLLFSFPAFYLLIVLEQQLVTLPLAVCLALYWALTTLTWSPWLWSIILPISLGFYIYYIRRKTP